MISVLIMIVIAACVGGMLWLRQRRWRAYATDVEPTAVPIETLALQAFAQGNSYLVAGKFREAIAAFHQARKIDPKRPYVADRIAETERRQQAANAAPRVSVAV